MSQKDNNLKFIIRLIVWPFRSYLRILLVVLVFVVAELQSSQLDIIARQITTLDEVKKQLLHENARMESEINKLTNINVIQKKAREQFGLIEAGNLSGKLVINKYEAKDGIEEKEIKMAGVH